MSNNSIKVTLTSLPKMNCLRGVVCKKAAEYRSISTAKYYVAVIVMCQCLPVSLNSPVLHQR